MNQKSKRSLCNDKFSQIKSENDQKNSDNKPSKPCSLKKLSEMGTKMKSKSVYFNFGNDIIKKQHSPLNMRSEKEEIEGSINNRPNSISITRIKTRFQSCVMNNELNRISDKPISLKTQLIFFLEIISEKVCPLLDFIKIGLSTGKCVKILQFSLAL